MALETLIVNYTGIPSPMQRPLSDWLPFSRIKEAPLGASFLIS
jgi:hypothetical protein